jgi:MioC protein
MTGTSELVAEEVEYRLRPLGFDIKIVPMDNAQPDVLEPGGRYIFCTSTYGQGDIPDNGKAFFAALEKLAPDLSGISYTVIALGDLTYAATFCNGGLTFDRLLQHLGATRFTDILRLDASSGLLAEDTAADWAESWASPHTASSA